MLSLDGHHALVTGSTKGVGLAIARSLARAGANLVLNCRKDGPEAQQALEVCRAEGVEVALVTADLSGETDACVGKLFDEGINASITSQRALPSNLLYPKVKNRSRVFYQMANIEASMFRGKNNSNNISILLRLSFASASLI